MRLPYVLWLPCFYVASYIIARHKKDVNGNFPYAVILYSVQAYKKTWVMEPEHVGKNHFCYLPEGIFPTWFPKKYGRREGYV